MICAGTWVCVGQLDSQSPETGEGNERQIWTQVLALLLAICQLQFESNFPSLSLPIYKQGQRIAT